MRVRFTEPFRFPILRQRGIPGGRNSCRDVQEEQARMTRLSMNELTTFRWSFEQDVAQYLAAGFGAIGVWRQKLSDYGEEKGIELLAESGLQVSNLLWAGGFTGSDGRTFRESIED